MSLSHDWSHTFAHNERIPKDMRTGEPMKDKVCVLFKINAKTAKDVQPWSEYEQEFILLPNTKLKTISMEKKTNYGLVDLNKDQLKDYLNNKGWTGLAALTDFNGRRLAEEFLIAEAKSNYDPFSEMMGWGYGTKDPVCLALEDLFNGSPPSTW